MAARKPGWTGLLRREGPDFLEWNRENQTLSRKFDVLAEALGSLLRRDIRTPEDAEKVWNAAPAVLCRCNDQATYELPRAAWAYAWLHLLDRYVRTWMALEYLVSADCLPMGRSGVRALDVGTGPGPSAFAIHDFYAAMVEFSKQSGSSKWRQSARVTCVELSPTTNQLRHHLAEIMFERSQRESPGVLAMTSALPDFGEILPTHERKQRLEYLRNAEEEYFNPETDGWDSDLVCSPEGADYLAQSLHRYRLFVFSNFLTTKDMPARFQPNLVDILSDAQPGSVLLLLGGKGKPYPEIYKSVDELAKPAGFEKVAGKVVSSSDSEVADRVDTEGKAFYEHLQRLALNTDDETRCVREHFEGSHCRASSSQLWAYRKYHHTRK